MTRSPRASLRAGALALAVSLACAASASAANVDVRGQWDLQCGGPCPPQIHNFETQDPVGKVTGRGQSESFTWTITGNVNESQIQFSVDYDNSTYSATMTGTVSADNQQITGTFSDGGFTNQPFTMNRMSPPPPAQPPPQAGETVNVRPVTGDVGVKCKGDSTYRDLESSDEIPVGCLLDTREGTVNITAATGQGDDTASSWFWQGIFRVSQKKGTNQETVVTLAGPLENCPTAKKAGSLEAAAKRRGRRLWGRGKGRFRTRGRRGSAAVRGTEWLVEDNCDGSTTVRVKEGSVNFLDFTKNRTVVVKKGGKYTARPR